MGGGYRGTVGRGLVFIAGIDWGRTFIGDRGIFENDMLGLGLTRRQNFESLPGPEYLGEFSRG